MKKTILCLLLALGLLLMSAAAMATSDPDNNSFDIEEGNITITDGNNPGTIKVLYGDNQKKDSINPESVITVRGYNPPNGLQLSIETEVPVKICYIVQLDSISNVYPMSIAANADVTLELFSSSIYLFGGNDQPAITLGSGSKLTVKGAVDSHEELRLYSSRSAILGPNSETSATVILDSGIVDIHRESSSGISGNVNLVINGGTVKANGTTINVQNLIITGGELWAGSDSSTKVTYKDLTENQGSYQNILCTVGILPYTVDYYNELVVFGKLTLPVDLTIPGGKLLGLKSNYGSSLTIPKDTSLTCNRLNINEGTTLTNDGTLTINDDSELLGEMTNTGTLCINSSLSMAREDKLGTLTNTGTISGSGSIYPRLSQNPPASLTVESFVNGTVTLKADGQGKTALEYSVDGNSWTENPVFTVVIPDAGQPFYARFKTDGQFYQASDKISITVYPVSLNANGGTIASGKDVGYYIAGQSTPLPAKDDMTRQNYSFEGWYDNSACTGTPITEIAKDANTAKTFWAKWTPDTYNLTLDANGGTINSGDLNSYTYGEGATLRPTCKKKTTNSRAGMPTKT